MCWLIFKYLGSYHHDICDVQYNFFMMVVCNYCLGVFGQFHITANKIQKKLLIKITNA